jgi:hypothetical protein
MFILVATYQVKQNIALQGSDEKSIFNELHIVLCETCHS